MRVTVNDIPERIRVRLDKPGKDRFWDRIEAQSITTFARAEGFDRQDVYNWRHHVETYPLAAVRTVLGNGAAAHITAIKGGASSAEIPVSFPLTVSGELLTRVTVSATVNTDGVPTYLTGDAGLADRFITLLEDIGEVSVSVYHRSQYEIRYPKVLQDIFDGLAYDGDLRARIDEIGRIEDKTIVLPNRRVPVHDFDGRLYHRGKRLQLALARGDSASIAEIMATEAGKVQQLVQE